MVVFLTDASPAPGASSASDASPASAASSASAASPAPGASSASDASSASSPPKYKLLTEDNIMLPKKLPSNILELLKVKNVYIGIKKDEPIDLKQKATPFTRVQIESLQNAVQVTGKNKEQDSKDSKQLVKQKVLISTYGEALKKMEENVNELEPKLKDKNELTKQLLGLIFKNLGEKIRDLKESLVNKDDMDTIKTNFQDLIKLWTRTIGPFEENKQIQEFALFKYDLESSNVMIPDNANFKQIEDVINKESTENRDNNPLNLFITYSENDSIKKFEKNTEVKKIVEEISDKIINGENPDKTLENILNDKKKVKQKQKH